MMSDENKAKPGGQKNAPQDQQHEAGGEKPRIIVDDDWKTQAAAEKEKLAEQVEQAGPSGEGQQGSRELPPASFVTLVNSLAMQALFALGGYEDPKTKKRVVDMGLAKHHIDTLGLLEEKCKGNLTDEEKKFLGRALYEARMQYVEFAQRLGRM